MIEDEHRCWACEQLLQGPLYQAFSLLEKRWGRYAWEGSGTRVALCDNCARAMTQTLNRLRLASRRPGDERGAEDGGT